MVSATAATASTTMAATAKKFEAEPWGARATGAGAGRGAGRGFGGSGAGWGAAAAGAGAGAGAGEDAGLAASGPESIFHLYARIFCVCVM